MKPEYANNLAITTAKGREELVFTLYSEYPISLDGDDDDVQGVREQVGNFIMSVPFARKILESLIEILEDFDAVV
ncbi:MAG: hypothetical protein FWE21_10355 [Defluviitaleaceae bacterium]|nr:hypothetical protein [Defluviitaleaceae bacterium]